MCYRDLPICDHINPAGRCWAWSGGVSDSWCVTASAMIDGSDRTKDKEQAFYNLCICEEVELPLAPLSHCRALEETTPRTQIVVGPEARTDKYIAPMKASHLPPRDAEMVAIVIEECIKGPKASQCSSKNWFDQPEQCSASCVHVALLRPPPYYAVWRSGPRARPWLSNSVLPHYA